MRSARYFSNTYVEVEIIAPQDLAQRPASDALVADLLVDADFLEVRYDGVGVELAAPDTPALVSEFALDVSAAIEERSREVGRFV